MQVYNNTYWLANLNQWKSQYSTWQNEITKLQSELIRVQSELRVYQELSQEMHQLNKQLPTLQFDKTVTNAFNLTPELFNILKTATTLQWIKDAAKAVKLTEFQKDNLELTDKLDFIYNQRAIANKANLEQQISGITSSLNHYKHQFSNLLGQIDDTISHFRKIIRNNQHLTTNSYNVEGFDFDNTNLQSIIKQIEEK